MRCNNCVWFKFENSKKLVKVCSIFEDLNEEEIEKCPVFEEKTCLNCPYFMLDCDGGEVDYKTCKNL